MTMDISNNLGADAAAPFVPAAITVRADEITCRDQVGGQNVLLVSHGRSGRVFIVLAIGTLDCRPDAPVEITQGTAT